MSGTRRRRQSEEDRRLWSTVARTVRPLPGRQPESDPEEAAAPETPRGWPVPPPVPRTSQVRTTDGPPRPSTIDRMTRRKLSRGRIGIDASIDLHDMTQERAHGALLAFLRDAHARRLRHVLVITGKGTAAGSGVLRTVVPHWLATPPFASLVSSFDTAGRSHGGDGAIYVKLRRQAR